MNYQVGTEIVLYYHFCSRHCIDIYAEHCMHILHSTSDISKVYGSIVFEGLS